MDRPTGGTDRDAELAALRARLAAVEAALGGPGPWRAPATAAAPTLPALARRVAALEQGGRGGPRLVPLVPPGLADSAPDPADPPPASRPPPWRAAGQAALAAAVLLALAVWLLRPAVGARPAMVPAPASPPPATASAAPPRAVPAAPATARTLDDRAVLPPPDYRVSPVDGAPGVDGRSGAPAGAGWPVVPGDPDSRPRARPYDDLDAGCIPNLGPCP